MITRGTTPTITFIYRDKIDHEPVDLSSYTIFLSIADRRGHIIEFTNDRMVFNEDFSVDIELTQEETLELQGTILTIQMRGINASGKALASNMANCELGDIIKDGVIEYGSTNS